MIAATTKKTQSQMLCLLLERAKISSYVHETGPSNAINDPFLDQKATELLFCDDGNRNENAEIRKVMINVNV